MFWRVNTSTLVGLTPQEAFLHNIKFLIQNFVRLGVAVMTVCNLSHIIGKMVKVVPFSHSRRNMLDAFQTLLNQCSLAWLFSSEPWKFSFLSKPRADFPNKKDDEVDELFEKLFYLLVLKITLTSLHNGS